METALLNVIESVVLEELSHYELFRAALEVHYL